jgi:hypothetical protein
LDLSFFLVRGRREAEEEKKMAKNMQIILTRWQLAADAGRRWQTTARPPTSSS